MRQINRVDAQPSDLLRRLLEGRASRDGKRTSTRPLSEKRIKRMHAVLVTALNGKSARKVLPVNPAAGVEFRTGKTRPLLWTAERVDRHANTGWKPGPVMVWTQVQAGQFLDAVASDRLYPLWHLAVFWGLRRGELVGLDWADVRLDARRVAVRQSQPDTQTETPKTEAGDRMITVDAETARVLRAWRTAQLYERVAWGAGWIDSGRVFTREDGSELRPGHVSDRFRRLVGAVGLPPVRFHDLRHGSATMLLTARVPMKVVSEILGHASSAFTADVYTSVSDDLAEAAADAIAAFIPRKTRSIGDA
jgi:integrase